MLDNPEILVPGSAGVVLLLVVFMVRFLVKSWVKQQCFIQEHVIASALEQKAARLALEHNNEALKDLTVVNREMLGYLRGLTGR